MATFGFESQENKGSALGGGSGGGGSSSGGDELTPEEKLAALYEAIEKDRERSVEGEGSSLQQVLKEKIAEHGIKLEFEMLQIARKKQQMFINAHQIITDVGIFVQNEGGEQALYTEKFTYDPFRTSFGSIWRYRLDTGQLRTLNPGAGVGELQQLLTSNTPQQIAGIVGTEGIQYSKSIIPLVKFRFPSFLKFNGITHVKYSPPVMMSPDNAFASKVLGQSMSQHMFVYFDFSNYMTIHHKIVPFNIFFNIKQKLEGYTFANDNFVNGVAALDFRGPEGSVLNYNACFVDPTRDLNNLIDQGIFNSKETQDLQDPQFGQSNLIYDIENTIFSDHTINAPHAISEEALPFFGSETIQGNLVADVKPIYNYFLPEWEVATPELPELFIGNIYAAAYQSSFGQLNSEYNFKQFAYEMDQLLSEQRRIWKTS